MLAEIRAYFVWWLQNNVLELWSLFDFLMPGFLGTERQVFVKFIVHEIYNQQLS